MTSKKTEQTGELGRPSKYKSEYADLAYKYAILGAIDTQLAEFFDVDLSTLNRWKVVHPEFKESINKGKQVADAEVAYKLFKRATGYSHEATKIFNNQGEIITEQYVEHYPPDTGAAIFWLKNRQKALWRDKQEIEISADDNLADTLALARKRAAGEA